MAQQTIGLGSAADDGTGDTLRAGGDKINDNFTELYTADAANLKAANNLSDLDDAATARDNISAANAPELNAQTGTTYTLALTDAGDVVELTNASAITLTIPTNSSVAFPVGTAIEIHQGGAGTVTVAGDTGVTLVSRGSLFDLAGQEAVAAIRKVATDTWRLTGDIA